jgi:cobalt-zinc-cadmium efflux system outer membrane protein
LICLSFCLGMVVVQPAPAQEHATPAPLDRDTVLQLARERSPQVLAARERLDQAAGDLVSARAWAYNPELELEWTRRTMPDGEAEDHGWRVDQRLDLAGRGPRIGAAKADLEAAEWQRLDAGTAAAAEAARAWLVAVHAGAQRALASEGSAVQERLRVVAAARHAAGETGALDEALAMVAVARARAALADSRAVEFDALADLGALLQIDGIGLPVVSGDLAWPAPPALEAVREAALAQPGLEALDAAKEAADARRSLAGSLAWPELGVFGGAGREENDDLRTLGLTLSVPVFARGQGERKTTAAAARLAEVELDAARRTRLAQVTAAWHRQRELQAAVDTDSDATAAALDASVRLSEAAYRLGEIHLDEALLAQHQQLEARRELNDLRLSAALAALDVAYLAALPPLHEGTTP